MDNVEKLDKCFEMIKRYDEKLLYHCQRTGCLAKSLARNKGYNENICNIICEAGYVHDIGKIVLPPEILNKRGKLTMAEKKLVNVHAYQGYRILQSLDYDNAVAEIVLFHHGTDKPRFSDIQNPEKEILNYADILQVADAYDALTSDRPYAAKRTHEQAMRIMETDGIFRMDILRILQNFYANSHSHA